MATYVTWLDFWVADAAKALPVLPDGRRPRSDAEAAWWMALSSLAQAAPRLAGGNADAQDSARLAFFGAILGFCNPDRTRQRAAFEQLSLAGSFTDGMLKGRGLKLSSRLVRALAYARAPETPEWIDLARSSCWYFDLPHQALLLGNLEVRAILTDPDPKGGVAAVAILTQPGEDAVAGRYSWMLIGDQTQPPIGSHAGDEIDPEELRRRISDFVSLVFLYFQTLERTEKLPRIDPTRHRSAVQRKLERRTKSLFAIHVLPEPADNFGRTTDALPQGAWTLDHQVAVRGHFRWQPHGPGRERRKLIFIEAHVRGADLPEKPPLTPLHQSRDRPKTA